VHVGHRQIDDQQVELPVLFQKVERLLTASSLDHIVAQCAYHDSCDGADSAVVVDHEDAGGRPGVAQALVAGFPGGL